MQYYYMMGNMTGGGWPPSVPLPIAYWKLDGNSNDSVGGNNGIDTSISYVPAKIKQGAVFNGTSSKIDISQIDLTGDFTVSFWFKLPATSSTYWGTVLCPTLGATGAIVIYNNAPYIGLVAVAGNVVTTSTVTRLTPDVWTHITVTRNNDNIRIYLNAVQDGSIGSITGTVSYNLMGYTQQYFATLEGTVDELGVWNRTLSAEEILLLYNSGTGF